MPVPERIGPSTGGGHEPPPVAASGSMFQMSRPDAVGVRPSPLVWNWSDAVFGALIAVPAAIVAADDVSRGVAFAVGVLPAAVVGVAPVRRRRALLILVGVAAGVAMFAGALLAHVPILAVCGIFALAVGAALLAERIPLGRLAMVLALPLVGIGLSYTDVTEAAGLSLIIGAGSVWAFVISLAWPVSEPPAADPPGSGAAPSMLDYGIRLGLAAAVAAGIGFVFDLAHVGWACAAVLLIMRPAEEMLELRAVGRLASVAIGATLAGVMATNVDPGVGYSVAVLVAIAGAAATHRSHWYVTSAFSTFLVITMLVSSDPSQAGSRWLERVGETLLGAALAYLFGVAVPQLRRRFS